MSLRACCCLVVPAGNALGATPLVRSANDARWTENGIRKIPIETAARQSRADPSARTQPVIAMHLGQRRKHDEGRRHLRADRKPDLQKIEEAQADLAPERQQPVQDAATAFGTQLRDIAQQAIAGLCRRPTPRRRPRAAAASLESAVKTSLQPIDC